jgi:hypothetical protein
MRERFALDLERGDRLGDVGLVHQSASRLWRKIASSTATASRLVKTPSAIRLSTAVMQGSGARLVQAKGSRVCHRKGRVSW